MISVGDAMSDTVRTLVAAALISFMSGMFGIYTSSSIGFHQSISHNSAIIVRIKNFYFTN